MRACGWWIRWYHRRLRHLDREIMFASLSERGREHAVPELDIKLMIHAFTEAPGQEHWRCPCAQGEQAMPKRTPA